MGRSDFAEFLILAEAIFDFNPEQALNTKKALVFLQFYCLGF